MKNSYIKDFLKLLSKKMYPISKTLHYTATRATISRWYIDSYKTGTRMAIS